MNPRSLRPLSATRTPYGARQAALRRGQPAQSEPLPRQRRWHARIGPDDPQRQSARTRADQLELPPPNDGVEEKRDRRWIVAHS